MGEREGGGGGGGGGGVCVMDEYRFEGNAWFFEVSEERLSLIVVHIPNTHIKSFKAYKIHKISKAIQL